MSESESSNTAGFAAALELWQENQLRILVLISLATQCFLFVFAPLRQHRIPGPLRLSIWLAYLGSDAVAIYALATLFNSHRCDTGTGTGTARAGVELLWAPIMLVHLGGQDSIPAYNIEDNELWRRHVVTAVSQVAAAIYVFVKSWPKSMAATAAHLVVDQDTRNRINAFMAHKSEMAAYGRILGPALLLFFSGITKCVCKPWDLKRVSVNSLVDSSSSGSSEEKGDAGESEMMDSLQEYVGAAAQYFESVGHEEEEEDDDAACKADEVWKPYNLCVDLAPPYSGRLSCLKHLARSPADEAHRLVKSSLSATFHQLYTKESLKLHDMSHIVLTDNRALNRLKLVTSARGLRTVAAATLLGAIAAFYGEGDVDQDPTDVTITYALLWSAFVMECVLPTVIHHTFAWIERLFTGHRTWPDQVAQYSLMGYVARGRSHSWLMKAVACLGCGDLVDQLWTMKPRMGASSREITGLVHAHVAGAWMQGHIAGADSFRAFNDYRGQWTLGNCREIGVGVSSSMVVLMSSVSRPFDESVLVWHLATDFCFHLLQVQGDPSRANATARRCIEMSNYMAYLLFVKPEMLMPGARRKLFRDACRELVGLLEEDRPDAPRARGKRDLAHKVVQLLKRDGDDVLGSAGVGVVRRAWCVAEKLVDSHSGDEEKMWTVIQGVWVEMLCFSASRCKGYLHAKGLGTGGEYLSYVWLLLLYMGMETLAEKMQRTELYEGSTAAALSISGQNV
ncbi:uncharacterized protein LOC100383195 [Zea mays]|uniref:OSJNBb0045P24.5-like protein n=2 Tax=Zea mays TaxID=4577 RepID=K7U8F1_MAIZE|nr:uncharacterized protein LOC100383195 [Zea mays]AQK58389.1 OSJNBb0045P24.5-like protein [Zea mays]|eukprot:NP_001305890.1 uncharacterized protein LOC100383195 [Zea mays]